MGEPVDVGRALGGQHQVVVRGSPVVAAERREVAAVLRHEMQRCDPVPADGGAALEVDAELVDAARLRAPARRRGPGSGVDRLAAPRSSSAPQRPQLFSRGLIPVGPPLRQYDTAFYIVVHKRRQTRSRGRPEER